MREDGQLVDTCRAPRRPEVDDDRLSQLPDANLMAIERLDGEPGRRVAEERRACQGGVLEAPGQAQHDTRSEDDRACRDRCPATSIHGAESSATAFACAMRA